MASTSGKSSGSSTKHTQIRQASTQTFITVALASVLVSMALVMLNILWGTAQFNMRVHEKQEIARDALEANIAAVGPLTESFERLEIGSDLIPNQPGDKNNSEVILDALPSRYDFPELAASLNNLAEVSTVQLKSFRGTDLGSDAIQSSPAPFAESIPFSVEVEGSYQGVTKFLSNLEKSIRPMKVLSVGMSGTDSKLTANINIETQYQPAFDLTIRKDGVR